MTEYDQAEDVCAARPFAEGPLGGRAEFPLKEQATCQERQYWTLVLRALGPSQHLGINFIKEKENKKSKYYHQKVALHITFIRLSCKRPHRYKKGEKIRLCTQTGCRAEILSGVGLRDPGCPLRQVFG